MSQESHLPEEENTGTIPWSSGICPYCGESMLSGFYRAGYAAGRTITHNFVPAEEDEPTVMPKLLLISRLPLKNEGTGFYCENCGKAFIEFSAPEDPELPFD